MLSVTLLLDLLLLQLLSCGTVHTRDKKAKPWPRCWLMPFKQELRGAMDRERELRGAMDREQELRGAMEREQKLRGAMEREQELLGAM